MARIPDEAPERLKREVSLARLIEAAWEFAQFLKRACFSDYRGPRHQR